jgi:hypothetical protein
VTNQSWEELRIEIDPDDPDFDSFSKDEQDAIVDAIAQYAKTGRGGTVAYAAPGSIPGDVLRVDRIAIDVRVNVDNPKGPTLVVGGFSVVEDELPEGDD